VIEVLARDRCRWVVTHRKPNLSAVGGVQIVRRSRTSHLRCHPTRLKSVGENIRPAACDRKGYQNIVQFGVGVSLLPLARAILPREILQTRIAAPVQA
jgi:hypothetical protein